MTTTPGRREAIDDLPEVEVGMAIQSEEHVEPDRWADEGVLDNGVHIYEQRTPQYTNAPKHPKFSHDRRDFYAGCPVCGWTDHQPTLSVIRRHAREHTCLIG